jgi:hypothetical protein
MMALSLWDWLVFGGAGAMTVALICLAIALLELRNGPIQAILRRSKSFSFVIYRFLGSLYRVTYGNDERVERVTAEVSGIAEGLTSAVRAPEGATINWRTLAAAWASLRSGRRMVRMATGLVSRRQNGAPPGPVAPPRRSLADRLGLVPPAARHVGRYLPYVRSAIDTYRELRRRGVL